VTSQPDGPIHRLAESHTVNAWNTVWRGASNVRVISSARSPGVSNDVSPMVSMITFRLRSPYRTIR
jgi:hypothetical protein